MRLRSAVVLICLALSLIGTFYGAYSRFNVAEQIIIEETYDNFEKVAELKKFQIESFIESEKEKLEILKSCPAILNILHANKEGNFNSNLYSQAKKRIDNLNLGTGVFDKNGIIVVSENNPPGTNYSEMVLGNYDFKILYYYDHTRKNNFLGILSPIFDEDTKEKIGYIGFDIELEELNNLVKEGSAIGKTGEIYLIDSDKILMTSSRFLENGQFMQEVDTVNSQRCFDNKNGMVEEFLDYRGEKSIGTHRHLPFINWCLIIEIEKGELLDEIIDKLLWSSILISLAIIASLALLGFFWEIIWKKLI